MEEIETGFNKKKRIKPKAKKEAISTFETASFLCRPKCQNIEPIS
jgi:hypothetical protein